MIEIGDNPFAISSRGALAIFANDVVKKFYSEDIAGSDESWRATLPSVDMEDEVPELELNDTPETVDHKENKVQINFNIQGDVWLKTMESQMFMLDGETGKCKSQTGLGNKRRIDWFALT